MKMFSFRNLFARHRNSDDDGGIYIFGLYIFVAIATISGIAIDVSHLNAERTRLQNATDLAAHAALFNRSTNSSSDSIAAALEVVERVMPARVYGTILTASDFHFGTYDYESDSFTRDAHSSAGVLVTASRETASNNAVRSFLLQFAGISEFDMSTQSVFTAYSPGCMREGFVAEGVVRVRSNNDFTDGFCIHSNTHVTLSQNNYFEAGTVVSMPNTDDLDIPSSGFSKNQGLQEALRSDHQQIRILTMIDEIAAGLLDYGSVHMPEYIDDRRVYYHYGKKFDPSDFEPGTINYLDCSSATLNGGTYTNVVIYSECEVKFGNGVIFDNAIVFSESTSAKAFNSPSGLQIGRDDRCSPGGGAQLITYGGLDFAAKLSVYGGQLIAEGDIVFAAQAEGQGASFIAGGEIDGKTHIDMGYCGTGMENNFEGNYLRLAH